MQEIERDIRRALAGRRGPGRGSDVRAGVDDRLDIGYGAGQARAYIAPPGWADAPASATTVVQLERAARVKCPLRFRRNDYDSEFGSTACKSLRVCRAWRAVEFKTICSPLRSVTPFGKFSRLTDRKHNYFGPTRSDTVFTVRVKLRRDAVEAFVGRCGAALPVTRSLDVTVAFCEFQSTGWDRYQPDKEVDQATRCGVEPNDRIRQRG